MRNRKCPECSGQIVHTAAGRECQDCHYRPRPGDVGFTTDDGTPAIEGQKPIGEQPKTTHIIDVESTQIHRGSIPPEMAEFLTNEGTSRNILGHEFEGQGPSLDFHKEIKRTYECSCGQRFRKGKTAREHLESVLEERD